jgi:DNA-binding NtrC family response regulator
VPSITLPVGTSLAEAERALILATLQHCNHHKERTAAALGVSLKTLYNRLKEYSADDLGEPTEVAGAARGKGR